MSKEKNLLSNLFGSRSKGGCCNMEIVEETENNCCPETKDPKENASCGSCDCSPEKTE